MEAMDVELKQRKEGGGKPKTVDEILGEEKASDGKSKGKGKGKGKPVLSHMNNLKATLPDLPTEEDLEDMDEDDLAAMDRELRAALKNAGIDEDDMSDREDGDGDEEMKEAIDGLGSEEKREFKMMKDFLESYSSQAGGAGAVGNLFGRLAKS